LQRGERGRKKREGEERDREGGEGAVREERRKLKQDRRLAKASPGNNTL